MADFTPEVLRPYIGLYRILRSPRYRRTSPTPSNSYAWGPYSGSAGPLGAVATAQPNPRVVLSAIVPENNIVNFEMVQRTNAVGQWRATLLVDPNNLHEDIHELMEAIHTRGVFAQVFCAPESFDGRLGSIFNQGAIYTASNSSNVSWASLLPSWTFRGMLGPLMSVTTERQGNDTRIVLEGACALQWLADTLHWSGEFRIRPNSTADIIRYELYQLFSSNAEYVRSIPVPYDAIPFFALSSTPTSLGASGDEIRPTQIGKFLLQPVMTSRALTWLRTAGNFPSMMVEPGSHSVLDALTSMAENGGLLFNGCSNVILIDRPQPRNIVWGAAHIRSARVSNSRPEANRWLVEHYEAGNEFTWQADNLESVNFWGAIERQQSSSAPVGPELSLAQKKQIVLAQIGRDAVGQATEDSAVVDVEWTEGSRWGVDWHLGDSVTIDLFGNSRAAGVGKVTDLTIREVAVAMDSSGRWTFTPGLSPKSDAIPHLGYRADIRM